MKKVLAAAGIALSVAMAASPSAWAQDEANGSGAEFRATTLSLSAEGEVRARPDLAVISVGVRIEAPTAAAALAQNRTQMNATLAALRAQGVAEADIRTSNLSLEPQYFFDNKGPRKLTGYQAANTVSVRLHDLRRVGAVVDALVAAGANQIDGISFQIDDRTALEDAARQKAVKALQAKAELYAQASGYRVQRLVRLSEGGGFAPQPVPMMRMAAEAVTTVEPGELTVRVGVSGVYELAR